MRRESLIFARDINKVGLFTVYPPNPEKGEE